MPAGKRFQLNFLVLSVSYILMGLLLLLLPAERSRLLISYVLAAIVLVLGLIRFSFFFIKDEISRVFKNDLAIGAIMILAGLYLISHAEAVWAWIPVVLGFVVVFDSIIKVQNAFELKRMNFKYWWLLLIAGLITLILGALLIIEVFAQDILYTYLAVVILIDGVFNLAALGVVSWQLRGAAQEGGSSGKKRPGLFSRGKNDAAGGPPVPTPPAGAAKGGSPSVSAPPAAPSSQGALPPDIPND